MASWFRSRDMTYVSIIVNADAAHGCIIELGRMGVVQFTDLNPDLTPFQRRYVAYIKRVDELERKMKFFQDEVNKFNLPITPVGRIEDFVRTQARAGAADGGRTGQYLLETLEGSLESMEKQLLELNRYSERLTVEYNEKVEFQEVLLKSKGFFNSEMDRIRVEEQGAGVRGYQDSAVNIQGTRDSEMRFSYIAGVVARDDRGRFERQLFRTTRGNCYARFSEIEQPIEDPVTGVAVVKEVFIIFYKSTAIEGKIKKIADAFGAKRYPLPDMDNGEQVTIMMNENYSDLHDARVILLKNRDARLELCVSLADRLEEWSWTILREKSAYHTLNMFKPDVRGILRGEGWVVTEALQDVQGAVNKTHATMDMGMPSMVEVMPRPWPTAPTYFKTNAFTYAFQEFVNTYGVPRYKEANPALFTAGTFPFLYGVMYGDIGHGTCIVLLGLYLVTTWGSVKNNRNLGELMSGMYMGRWMLLLMGIFSVYCGLIYNDFFSIGLNLFGTTYFWPDGAESEGGTEAVNVLPYGDPAGVYPFGVDPAWHVAANELLFFNSMKMKMSVCLGITQMTGGILLKAANALYFHEPLDFFFEFIPMIVFDLCLFGYMVILIFVKWSIDWQSRMLSATCIDGSTNWGLACTGDETTAELCPLNYGGTGDGCQPPNLITTLINIALQPGSVDEPMYAGQAGVQTALLLIAFLMVPILLCAKPMVLKSRMDRANRNDSFSSETHLMMEDGAAGEEAGGHGPSAAGGHGAGHGGDGGDHGNFGEIVIHQGIETIEFVLGMVSNTASYLRLWALSLAHTELAAVFWEKAMLSTIEMNNPIAVFVGFAVFWVVTFAVLLCMDVLECFLHALRLHWVEFQNKFYKADGFRFQPYSHISLIESAPPLTS